MSVAVAPAERSDQVRPDPPPSARSRTVLLATLAVLLATAVQLVRGPGLPVWRGVFGEDGGIFLTQALASHGWGSLFTPYQGYVQFVPRLLAEAITEQIYRSISNLLYCSIPSQWNLLECGTTLLRVSASQPCHTLCTHNGPRCDDITCYAPRSVFNSRRSRQSVHASLSDGNMCLQSHALEMERRRHKNNASTSRRIGSSIRISSRRFDEMGKRSFKRVERANCIDIDNRLECIRESPEMGDRKLPAAPAMQ